MKNLILSILALTLLTSTTCEKEKGCTDIKALNHSFSAEMDDGSCQYSTAVFYGAFFSPCPPVTVQVNGSNIGVIEAAYPNGPGNCSVPGVAKYYFQSGETVDWIATDPCGTVFSGTLSPKSSADCIKVRVY